MDLLDKIAAKLNCTYVSDLHDSERFKDLIDLIGKLNCEDYTHREWCDAYKYIKGEDGSKLTKEEIYNLILKNS